MIKTTLVFVLLAIFVATIQAANPFDTNNRPFVIGGNFKRVEKKTPAASFACWNKTISDWTDYRWVDAPTASASVVSVFQLTNGHTVSLIRGDAGKYGLLYWNLETSTILTTTTTVLASNSDPVMYLSYDQKKLYIGSRFTRVGTNNYVTESPLKYRIFSFDISALPTLGAPNDVTSSYSLGTTYDLSSPKKVYPISGGNQLIFAYAGTTNPAFVVFDPSSTSWKEVITSNIRSNDNDFLTLHTGTGELYAKSYDTTAPYASSFWKYSSDSSSFTNVKTLASSTYVTSLTAANYIAKWTVGTGGIYFAVNSPGTGNFENGMQNIQRITLTPSVTDPVSLSKTRLTTSTDRTVDTATIASVISSMYYDEIIGQLVVVLTGEGYQVYGSRESDLTKQKYELTYRFQPMGRMVAYDATNDVFVVPYGGGFDGAVSRYNVFISTTTTVSCFATSSYYRTWAPNFAVYDEGKDMFVAENLLSGQIDYDWQNDQAASVNAVENSDDSSIVYVGGYFRTIGGVVYNSIVSRTKTGLVALGSGLRIHNFDYNTFDNRPGIVKKLIRSKDNKYLFVSGTFNRAGDLWVNGLAYWDIDKKTWNKLETNSMDTVNDMDYDGRYLYVVGTINRAGKYVVKNAARFDMDTKTWLPMNDGLSTAATTGIVVDGKFIANAAAGSGVTFFKNLAVWSSNSWKAIEMDEATNNGCYQDKQLCTSQVPITAMTYYKGKVYFISGNYVYVSDTSMSKAVLYARGALGTVTSATRFFNYPKSNTIAVAAIGDVNFVEYNIDTKNIQHTNTRDGYALADAPILAISAAPKNVFAVVAVIVSLIVTLFF